MKDDDLKHIWQALHRHVSDCAQEQMWRHHIYRPTSLKARTVYEHKNTPYKHTTAVNFHFTA